MVSLIVASAFAALPAPLLDYTTWYTTDQGKAAAPKMVEVTTLPDRDAPLPEGAAPRLMKLGLRTMADGMPASAGGARWSGKKVEHTAGNASGMPALFATAHALADRRWGLTKRTRAPVTDIDAGLVRVLLTEGTAWYELTRYVLQKAPADPILAQQWGTYGEALSRDARSRAWLSRYDALRSVIGLCGLAVRAEWDVGRLSEPKDTTGTAWAARLATPPSGTAALLDPDAEPPVLLSLSGTDIVGRDRVGELATAWAVEAPERVGWLFQTWSNDAAAGLVGDAWFDLRTTAGGDAAAWVTMWKDPDERLQFALAWRHAQAEGHRLRWIGDRAAIFTWGMDTAAEDAFVARVQSAGFTQAGASWPP